MLAAENLALMRGGKRVVEGLSASLAPGTITAILGPNGAGKSSLLMGLAGLLEPAEGRVMLDGQSLAELPPRKRARSIGYLPQTPEIAWDVAVRNLVALGRLPWGDDGADAVAAAITALGLEPLANRPASHLSGGERARVLLARVLAGTPQWILADEPLAALDLAHQLGLIAHLKSCAAAGQGVVVVLHDLALAMNHADRVLVLHEGRLVADGTPAAALGAEVIEQVWGVKARWLGEPGARALTVSD
ncbi:MAG: ABC transporter ATP-binding protein [Erythrobacter sp.]|jgi:iron complex transport system ATP-binding protein|uniref:ABC transporter ATP-binding protein n=1 Tax=Erythrobacter sp. TaxID=1042 RepID=UPI002B478059|nr:ABC transporter ATP-binding protein [Erythrobacter sp.]WRH71339.1 MAG: ABC transporter ATP-binding protein [Erythrobacter sp.]